MAAWIGATGDGEDRTRRSSGAHGDARVRHVGAAVSGMLREHADDIAAPGRACVSRSRGSPCATSAATAAYRCHARRFTDDGGADRGRPRDRHRLRVDRGCRAGARAAAACVREREAGRDRQQGAARDARAMSCSTRRTRAGGDLYFEAAVAGGIPLIRPLERIARRGARRPRPRDRERDDQLHPHADVRARLGLRGGARRGAAARVTPRPTPPPTSRGTTRPRSARSSRRWRSARVWSPTTSTGRASRRSRRRTSRTRRGSATSIKLLAIAELEEEEISVRVHPAMIPADAPARGRPRGVQRGVRRGPEDRAADVLRRRRGRGPDRDRRRRATS